MGYETDAARVAAERPAPGLPGPGVTGHAAAGAGYPPGSRFASRPPGRRAVARERVGDEQHPALRAGSRGAGAHPGGLVRKPTSRGCLRPRRSPGSVTRGRCDPSSPGIPIGVGTLRGRSSGHPLGRGPGAVLVRVGTRSGRGARRLASGILLGRDRGRGPLSFRHQHEAIRLVDDPVDVVYHVVAHHDELPGVGSHLVVLVESDGEEAITDFLPALAHHPDGLVAPLRFLLVGVLDLLVDLSRGRLVFGDPFLAAAHAGYGTSPAGGAAGALPAPGGSVRDTGQETLRIP